MFRESQLLLYNEMKKLNVLDAVRFNEYFLEMSVFEDFDNMNSNMIIIKTSDDGIWLKAPKKILCEKSAVFNEIYGNEGISENTEQKAMTLFTANTMADLLRFLCFGNCFEDFSLELYEAAKAYKIDTLLEICAASIEASVSFSNVFVILNFAAVHGEKRIFDACCNLIGR